MYVCICKGITEQQVEDALETGHAESMSDLRQSLGLGTQCGRCACYAKERLAARTRVEQPPANTPFFVNAGAAEVTAADAALA